MKTVGEFSERKVVRKRQKERGSKRARQEEKERGGMKYRMLYIARETQNKREIVRRDNKKKTL
jgi:hypothetical protein